MGRAVFSEKGGDRRLFFFIYLQRKTSSLTIGRIGGERGWGHCEAEKTGTYHSYIKRYTFRRVEKRVMNKEKRQNMHVLTASSGRWSRSLRCFCELDKNMLTIFLVSE